MKCGKQEKTANSPLRRPNSLHHQQHFINKQRRAEHESSAQTQIDARTVVLLRSERLQDISKTFKTHHSQETNHPHAQPSCVLGCVAATPSWEIVTTFLQFQGFFFFKTLMLLRLSLETRIKQLSASPRVIAAAASLWPALFSSSARRIWRCSHQMDEESLQGGWDLCGFP